MRTSFCLLLCLAVNGCSDALPQREQPVGTCTLEADCGTSGQVCKANQCVPCSAHGDCASQVCDSYGDLGGVGRCAPPSNIIYVNNSDPDAQDCAVGQGTQALPFCEVAQAMAQLAVQPGKIISLQKSPTAYQVPPLDSTPGSVVLVGPGASAAGKQAVLVTTALDAHLQVGGGTSLVLDGVVLSVAGISAAPNAKVALRQSTITSLEHGAAFDGSQVTLDRDLFTQNNLRLSFSSSTVSITNTVIAGNAAEPSMNLIEVIGGSGVFQFNTVAYNSLSSTTAPVLSCVNAAGFAVKNSIFVQNGSTQQLAPGCAAVGNSLIVGQQDTTPGQLKQEPAFAAPALLDLRLQPLDPTNREFIFDKAVQVNPSAEKNVDHDYSGTPRPQGAGHDIGAFELLTR